LQLRELLRVREEKKELEDTIKKMEAMAVRLERSKAALKSSADLGAVKESIAAVEAALEAADIGEGAADDDRTRGWSPFCVPGKKDSTTHTQARITIRVTRLGEFSPIEQWFFSG
jgi:exonuclease VII small subunit